LLIDGESISVQDHQAHLSGAQQSILHFYMPISNIGGDEKGFTGKRFFNKKYFFLLKNIDSTRKNCIGVPTGRRTAWVA
jgi:hypothetical protein